MNVSPQPMMWPGGHQCSQNGCSASETSTVLKPRARSPSSLKTCSSFRRSMSNATEPFEPLTSHWKALRRPRANLVASTVPTAPLSNVTAASSASSTSPVRHEGVDEPGDRRDLADEEAREIDHVRAEVAEGARSRLLGLEAPRGEGRVVAPVLEVAAAEVADLAELAGLDQLAGQPHRRHEAVVEAAQVLDARRRHALPDLVALVGVAAERLLAEHVLARLGRGDRRLGVQRVGAAVVEQADRRVGDEVAPVGRPALVAELGGDRPRPRPRSARPPRRAGAATACRGGRSPGTRASAPCP